MEDAGAVPHLVLRDFLTVEEHATLREFVHEDAQFSAAMVTDPGAFSGNADPNYRSASVADPNDRVSDLFIDKLTALLPHLRRELGVDHFVLGDLERQITSHGDGDFFAPHTDLGDMRQPSGSRRVSFVYYFHERPKAFTGGELVLHHEPEEPFDDEPDAGGEQVDPPASSSPAQAGTTVIEPIDNSIVFFPSWALHEVTPVEAEAEDAGAVRYTFNGWFNDLHHEREDPDLDPDTWTALATRYVPSITPTGFAKIQTPPSVHRALREAYDDRIGGGFSEPIDDVYLPTGCPDFLDIEDIKYRILDQMQMLHESWSGCELTPAAAYGLRVYRRGHSLIMHTDLPATHVVSSIVHIAHDSDEPWPLHFVDLEGTEHHIVLEEGETLLYESARCAHGRPTPLNGDAFCSLFLHYTPAGWDTNGWALVERAIAAGDTSLLPHELVHPEPPGS